MRIKSLIATFTLLVAFAVSAYAQNGFFMQNPATGQTYDAFNGVEPFGVGAFMTLYPKIGTTFPATSSGSCSAGATTCNGVRVNFEAQIQNFPNFNQQLLYVSPSQINLITTAGDVGYSTYAVRVVRASNGSVTDSEQLTTYYQVALPICVWQTIGGTSYPLIAGTLYDSTGTVVIKTLHDGNPNPRTYNGQPTVAQIYFTGHAFGRYTLLTLEQACLVSNSGISVVDNATAVTNIFAPGGGWTAGVRTIRPYLTNQNNTYFDAYIYWAN